MFGSEVEAAVKRDSYAADFKEPTIQPKQQSSQPASRAAPLKAQQQAQNNNLVQINDPTTITSSTGGNYVGQAQNDKPHGIGTYIS